MPGSLDSHTEQNLLVDQRELERLRELANAEPVDSVWIGEPVQIATSDSGTLRRISWRAGQEFGFGWHVRVAREDSLAVIGAARTRAFDTLLEESDVSVAAAVNGGFFDGEGRPLDLVISGGQEVTPFRATGGSGVFVLRDGEADIQHRRASTRGSQQALQSIDRIVDGGKSLVRRVSDRRAARAAVVISDDGVELVVVAHGESVREREDGVSVGFASGFGLTLAEFASYLLQTSGAEKALNLDGGPSVQLRFRTLDGQVLRVDGGGPTASGIVVVGESQE